MRKGSVLVFTGEFSEPVTTGMVEQMIRDDREKAAAGAAAQPTSSREPN